MSRTAVRALLAVLFAATGLFACNISDEGGGIEVECFEDSECPNGRCSNGICIDLGTNNDAGDGDAGNMTTTDAGPLDMSMPDMGDGEDMGGEDMGTPLECPDGFIDFNGNADDGCETVQFPGWDIQACQDCAGLPNAVAGCGGGDTCVIAACAEGFYDRDRDPTNGCETTCAPGECWDLVTAEQREFAFVDGPDFWFSMSAPGIVGRELTADEWTWHSLDGPTDFVASPVTDLHVVDEVIYGNERNQLVRSVDHGRSFGTWDAAPAGSLVDINEGFDGRYYLLVTDLACEPAACTDDSGCPQTTTCSVAESSCGQGACSVDADCGAGQRCSSDGVCLAEPAGCGSCPNPDACINPVYSVLATTDFDTFTQVGPELPAGSMPNYVHSPFNGFPIVTGTVGGNEDVRLNPLTNQWEQIESRNCNISHMVFLQSGDGVALGADCSFEYDGQEGKLNNRENIGGTPQAVLFRQDVLYVAGDGFISVSTNLGRGYDDRSIQGNAVHLYVESDGAVIALGSLGERWRSVDQGQSWARVAEARQPYPRQVETGSPLALMGIGQLGGIITPSPNGADSPWIQIASQNVQSIKQAQGAAFGFSTNPPLFSGTDWQSLNPMSVNTQRVNSGQWPACAGLSICEIENVPNVFDATYDGTTMYAVASVRIRFRPSTLVGWQRVVVPGILRSTNGVSWNGVQYLAGGTPQHIAASSFGLVTDRGYSLDGIEWFNTGTPTCGVGPFFRGPNGDVLGFGDGNVCTTSDGQTWDLLSEDFWPVDAALDARSVNIRNGAFFVGLGVGAVTAINASDDGMSWRAVGPRWPGGTDIAFGTTAAAVAHPQFFAISN